MQPIPTEVPAKSALGRTVGQPLAVRLLWHALERGTLAAGYLFEGMAGIGKATCARALAYALVCQDRSSGGCGTCDGCHKLLQGLHPDVLWVEPDGQFIKISQVRELTARAAFPPHEAWARLCVLDPADAMNPEAANALLKTLEEPPARTHFVLVSAAPARLPPTVRSRCQRVRFAPLGAATVTAALADRGIEAALAELSAKLCGGSLGRALELCGSAALKLARERAQRIQNAATQGPRAILELAQELKGERDELSLVLEQLQILHRDAAMLAAGAARERVMSGDLPEEVAALATLGPSRLSRRIAALAEVDETLRGNGNPQLCLERLMLRFAEC
jgi:DNA polymerase-3 subunit delta'